MIEDKYIGLGLAISSSLAIGTLPLALSASNFQEQVLL
jgi:hypothetical protein